MWGLIKTANTFHGNAIFYTMTGIDLKYYIGWIYPLLQEIYLFLYHNTIGS